MQPCVAPDSQVSTASNRKQNDGGKVVQFRLWAAHGLEPCSLKSTCVERK